MAAAASLCAAIFGPHALAASPDATAAQSGPASCRGTDLTPLPGNSASVASATLCLIDRIRAAWHLGPVRANAALRAVAASQVRNMVRWNYFSDIRPSGQTPMALIAATGYRAHASSVSVAQNIAWGTGPDATPARIVAAWMASPPHRRVILTRSFRDAGVAATPAVPSRFGQGSYGATYAIEFGARR
ncbi:MAG TPA: CAP domain-containing protein [Solirubrobacteraceae bacterium]|nr:CAP domain-containing protein [Solirubrobacteraceae bacterium]